jgi:exodeoxyribonuclease V alpha subunit
MQTDLQTIKGEVINQKTFDSGYAILRIRIEKGDTATLVGDMPNFAEGVIIQASVFKIEHPKYGMQYKIQEIEEKGFATKDAVVNYLSSNNFNGIGKAMARLVAEHFGESALEILDNNISRIYEVVGLPENKAKLIEEQWLANRSLHKITSQLLKFKLTTNMALKIYEEFADKSIEIVQKEPYRLTQIYGIGFHKADEIALSTGIKRDSMDRVKAAIFYVMDTALMQSGHCYVSHQSLGENVVNLLQRDVNAIDVLNAIKGLVKQGPLIIEDDKIYLSSIYQTEKRIAEYTSDMINYKGKTYYSTIEQLELDLQKVGMREIQFSEEQKTAIMSALNHRVFIITGGPGSGKTTITKAICALMELWKIDYKLCSPTGRAAKRLMESTGRPAKTIHRLLGFKQGAFEFSEENPMQTDCVIVDETSMVDLLLFNNLISAMETNDRLIMIGDVNQLPPVGPGNVLKDLINSNKIPYVKLTKVFRQDSKSSIITAAHDVITGNMPELVLPSQAKGRNFLFASADKIDDAIGIVKHLVTKTLPNVKVNNTNLTIDDIQIITPLREKGLGVNDVNPHIQESVNPAENGKEEIQIGAGDLKKIYRVGDRVMQIKNDYDKNVFNGDMGTIIGINKNVNPVQIGVRFTDVNEIVFYKQHELDNLQHAWCITCHKSQGGEFPAVIIIAHDSQTSMLQRNLFYTGLTRAKKICIVVGTQSAIKAAINNTKEAKRNTTLKDRVIHKIK